MPRLSESQKVKMEETHKCVDSEIFSNVFYAIDRQGKGMHIVYRDRIIIPVVAEDVYEFTDEIKRVWEHMRDGVSFDEWHPEKKLRIVR